MSFYPNVMSDGYGKEPPNPLINNSLIHTGTTPDISMLRAYYILLCSYMST